MDSPPPRSPSPRREDFDDYGMPPTLPLPAGTYTLLPLVESCDNLDLPTGPWEAKDCKERWEQHCNLKQAHREPTMTVNGNRGADASALADEDEEDTVTSEQEFLVPFFLSLPPSRNSTSNTPARRSSSLSGPRPSFSPLTPLPASSSSSPNDSLPKDTKSSAWPPAQPIGFLRPSIVRALIEDNRKLVNANMKPVWKFDPPISFPPPARRPSYGSSRPGSRRGSRTAITALSPGSATGSTPGTPGEGQGGGGAALESVREGLRNLAAGDQGDSPVYAVGFEDWVNEEGREARREQIERVVRGWKEAGQFLGCLGGWRDEEYTVWGPPSGEHGNNPLPGSNEAFRMERSACALFGVATFGVHCTAYVEEEGKPMRLWVPRRSATKPTWPSYLDNTTAGGITAGDNPRYSIIRECAEEASLPPSYVAPRIKQAGVITYNYRTADGWLQPEVQYVYDLLLPPPEQEGAIKPTTNPEDGEVESFDLMSIEEVVKKMVDGEFKPNCALVLIDFLIRHGLLTFESDSRFLEIATRLRRPLSLPGPA
ncbi:hypothetical protein JCM11641_001066 [Rhodosporidiobolus odoratus]